MTINDLVINIEEIVLLKLLELIQYNPVDSEIVPDLEEPLENLRFKSPFAILNLIVYEKLSNSVYRGMNPRNHDVNFMIMFNRKSEISYIHRSLVDVENCENVFVYLNLRDSYVTSFIAFVTDDITLEQSLVIGDPSIEILLNNTRGNPY